VLSPIVKLIRIASFVICLIVIGSFVVFAADQTKSASNHQTEELGEKPAGTGGPAKKENGFHEVLDEASNELTSPFSGIVSGSSSEWLIRGVKLILALLVYGFGLGYIARVLRVRV
jgi:hypothetical protein